MASTPATGTRAKSGARRPPPVLGRRVLIRRVSVAAFVLAAGIGAAMHLRSRLDDDARSNAAKALPVAATPALATSLPPAPAAPASAKAVPLPAIESRPLSIPELLAGNSMDWRVARLRENRQILVIEFPNLAEQGAAMNRLAALLEKAGTPRERVLSDSELATLIARSGDNAQTFYGGHDYEGAALARFFRLAETQRQALNLQEQRLRRVLVQTGLLSEGVPGPVAKGIQAVITFTAVQADDPTTPADETVDERRRDSVLRHELSHGRFFTRPAYREHCRRFWRGALTTIQREAIRTYLAKLGYDRSNEELMLNEAQALLMHTPDTRAFVADSVGISPGELAALRRRFWHDAPPDSAEP